MRSVYDMRSVHAPVALQGSAMLITYYSGAQPNGRRIGLATTAHWHALAAQAAASACRALQPEHASLPSVPACLPPAPAGVMGALMESGRVQPGLTPLRGISGGAWTAALTALGHSATAQRDAWKRWVAACRERFGSCHGHIRELSQVNLQGTALWGLVSFRAVCGGQGHVRCAEPWPAGWPPTPPPCVPADGVWRAAAGGCRTARWAGQAWWKRCAQRTCRARHGSHKRRHRNGRPCQT